MRNSERLTRADKRVLEAHHALVNGSGQLSYFAQRSIARETIEQARVGYWGEAFTYPSMSTEGKLLGIHCKSKSRDAKYKRSQWWDKERYSTELPLKGHGKTSREPAKIIPFGMETLKDLEPGSLIILCCGEEDALSLRQHGYTALSQPGAGLLEPVYAKELAGFEVVVFYDAGEEIEAHKDAVKLEQAGVRSVRVVEWPPEVPNGADVNDRLIENPNGFKVWAAQNIKAARPRTLTTPETKQRQGRRDRYAGDHNETPGAPAGKLLSEVEPELVEWLWEGRIPLGKLTLLEGDPGTGKSALTTDLAARVSTGRPLPDGTPCEAGGVVLLNAEDGLADTIRPRLDVAGGDPSKVLALATVPDKGGERLFSIPQDLDILRRAAEHVEARLVIVDPLMAFLSGNHNAHKDQDVRRALAPLAALATQTGAAVVVVRHLNKASGGSPLYRGGGSIGIIAAARSSLLVAEHPEDDEQRVLASLKSNVAKPSPSLAFALAVAQGGAVKVEYKRETPLDASALLAAPADDDERRELAGLRNGVEGLLEESGGSWRGEPKELYEILADRDLAVLPGRPDELTKLLKKLAQPSSTLRLASGRKRDGEKVVRELRLELSERYASESPNGVNGVHGDNAANKGRTLHDSVNTVNAMHTDTGIDGGVHSMDVRDHTKDKDGRASHLPVACIHGFRGGKGCYCCDPEHPYRIGKA